MNTVLATATIDTTQPSAQPYPSITALQAAHTRLQQLDEATLSYMAEVEAFIRRGQLTGRHLDLLEERRLAQALLDYWFDLWREMALSKGRPLTFDATLDRFDPKISLGIDVTKCPYVGLQTFRLQDSHFFFGRSQLTSYLVDRLREDRTEQERFLVLVGRSGIGKSSLIAAGLIPALAEGAITATGETPSSDLWHYYPVMVPGSNPLENLSQILDTVPNNDGEWRSPEPESFLSNSSLLATLIDMQCRRPAVLVVDQFEEIFTLCDDKEVRCAFLNHLEAVISKAKFRHTILLTMSIDLESYMRTQDLVDECRNFCALYENGRVHAPDLGATELRQVIERPARLVDLRFESSAIDAMIRDALSIRRALPLLQLTLVKLWENRNTEENVITLADYEALGGIHNALAQSANQVYNSLSDDEKVLAQEILLMMVKKAGDLDAGFSINRIRRNRVRELAGADPVLQKLIDASLVRLIPGATAADDQVEIVHEMLMDKWSIFADWLWEKRAELNLILRLEHAAKNWQATGPAPDVGALWGGASLLEAEEMIAQGDVDDPLVLEFVSASVAYREQEETEREKQRQRELAQAKQLTEQAQRLAEQTQQIADERGHKNTILTRSMIGLTCAVAVAIALIVVAVSFWQKAESNREEVTLTLARKWAGEAAALQAPQLQLLLAAEAAYRVGEFDQEWYQASDSGSATPMPESTNSQEEQPENPLENDLLKAAKADTGETLRYALGLTGGMPLRAGDNPTTSSAKALATSKDGRWLALGNDDGTISLWDTSRTYDTLVQTPIDFYTEITSIAFSPDGHWLVATNTKTARQEPAAIQPKVPDLLVLDMTAADLANAAVITIPQQRPVVGMGFVADANPPALYLLHQDGAIRRYTDFGAQAESKIIAQADGQFLDVDQFSISPDGKWMAAISVKGNRLYLWEVTPDGEVVPRHMDGEYTSFAFSPDGRRLVASQGDQSTISLFDLEDVTHAELPTPPRQDIDLPLGSVTVLVFAPDSLNFAAGYTSGIVGVWRIDQTDIDNRSPTMALYDHKQRVTALAFSARGDQLATSSADQFLRIWPITDQPGKPVYDKFASATPVTEIRWLDANRLITRSEEGLVQYWDTAESVTLDEMSVREAIGLACRRAGRTLSADEKRDYYVPDGEPAACDLMYPAARSQGQP